MDTYSYCLICGNPTNECDCADVFEDEVIEGKFRWEFQHEGCSYFGTKFKKNYADRDE